MDLGLARVQALLRRVGSPHTLFPVIHVAGTNGKGSTTAYLDALLTHGAGVRAARFNSPHLVTARDSVRVSGGELIDERVWAAACARTSQADAFDEPIRATPFELLTVQALVAFSLLPAATRPDVLLIEVGVGGRLDATNVFPAENVLASVVCPIALDHEGLLGKGLAAIAREKAGIVHPRGLCVVADQARVTRIPPAPTDVHPADLAVSETLCAVCEAQGARVAHVTVPWSQMTRAAPRSGATLPSATVSFSLSLHAPHATTVVWLELEATLARITGATTALQTLWSIAHDASGRYGALRERLRTRLFGDAALTHALAQYRWEGRCEWRAMPSVSADVQPPTPMLVDGAHNEASTLALRHYLEACIAPNATIAWILSFSHGKDVARMLEVLLAPGYRHRVVLVPFTTPVEGMPWVRPTALDAVAHAAAPLADVRVARTLDEALAMSASSAPNAAVLAGSLYLVSDFYRSVWAAPSPTG